MDGIAFEKKRREEIRARYPYVGRMEREENSQKISLEPRWDTRDISGGRKGGRKEGRNEERKTEGWKGGRNKGTALSSLLYPHPVIRISNELTESPTANQTKT